MPSPLSYARPCARRFGSHEDIRLSVRSMFLMYQPAVYKLRMESTGAIVRTLKSLRLRATIGVTAPKVPITSIALQHRVT